MSRSLAAAILATGALFAPGQVAAAQDRDYAVNQLVIYDDQECPSSTDEIITVCVRLSDQYRIPENLRQSDDPSNEPWTRRVESMEMVGAFGILSCSPVGSGGETGCTQQLINAAYGEKANAPNIRFGQLIEDARQERLSAIDEDAEETQRRVESLERQYMERLERERTGNLPGEQVSGEPAPVAEVPVGGDIAAQASGEDAPQ
ncbi:hypothetical protein [Altererythrobacter aquiaggeris]|uniref:hypothetical protein n=1 Tax=Aestuarierythrobacter aquiaggeris TaxID=1898396 RepID=UPI003018BB09